MWDMDGTHKDNSLIDPDASVKYDTEDFIGKVKQVIYHGENKQASATRLTGLLVHFGCITEYDNNNSPSYSQYSRQFAKPVSGGAIRA